MREGIGFVKLKGWHKRVVSQPPSLPILLLYPVCTTAWPHIYWWTCWWSVSPLNCKLQEGRGVFVHRCILSSWNIAWRVIGPWETWTEWRKLAMCRLRGRKAGLGAPELNATTGIFGMKLSLSVSLSRQPWVPSAAAFVLLSFPCGPPESAETTRGSALSQQHLWERLGFHGAKTTEVWCYGLNCVPPDSYVEVLTPRTPECDGIWRQVFKEVVKLKLGH